MHERRSITVDGNEAVASVAHRTNEVIAIYPITPASPMGELADSWSQAGRPNIWGVVPDVTEMQSEGGAAGAVLDYLRSLGITSVELLPVQAYIDEHHLAKRGLRNFWGYNTIAFFAPMPRFATRRPRHEMLEMVNAIHDAGMEVILDIAFKDRKSTRLNSSH